VQFSSLVVLADAHVGAPRGCPVDQLLEFLISAHTRGDGLVIAGDLFHFWFGTDRRPAARHDTVLAGLEATARRMPLIVLGGNHDRWGSGAWAERRGLAWHRDEVELRVGDRRVLALHGDQLGARGPANAAMHAVIGSAFTSAVFRAMPPGMAWHLADRLAEATYDDSPASRVAATGAAVRGAERLLATRPDVGWLITGHTHVAGIRQLASGQRHLNPGPWFEGGRYATLTPTGATLHTLD
jgi:UDP-2,3-diacylglucosamine pyrophosphatase LpxH